MNARWLRPNRLSWAALVGLIWAISFGALRDFVWSDLREGLIRFSGLNRIVRLLTVLGFGFLFAGVGILLTTDMWRAQSDLVPVFSPASGRGVLIPVSFLPLTIYMMAIAWSYLLAGALRVHPLVGFFPFALYTTTALTALVAAGGLATYIVWLGWTALLGLAILFVLPASRRISTDVAFLLCLMLVGLQYGLVQTQLLVQDRVSGIELGLVNLESSLQSLESLALPFLLLIGMDIARFTQQASTWTVLVVRQRLPDLVIYVVLLAFLIAQGITQIETLATFAATQGWPALAQAYGGGLGVVLGIVLAWALVTLLTRRAAAPLTPETLGEAAEQAVVWIIVLRLATAILTFALLQLQGLIGSMAYMSSGPLQNALLIGMALLAWTADQIAGLMDPWLRFMAVAALVGGLWLAWRRPAQRATALYVTAYGVLEIWHLLTRHPGPLTSLAWPDQAQVHLWLVVLVGLTTLVWGVRRTLTPARAAWLVFLLVILWLLRQTDFIENPFSPFFGFAGIGFIAFGIIWDALTAGAWANTESRRLPRAGRIFLYIGYVLLTVTLINWALATHNLDVIGRFTGDAALMGLGVVGKPLLYLFFPLILALPADNEIE